MHLNAQMVNHSIHHSTDGCCMLVMIRPISERTTPLQKEVTTQYLIGRDVSDESEGVSDSEKKRVVVNMKCNAQQKHSI